MTRILSKPALAAIVLVASTCAPPPVGRNPTLPTQPFGLTIGAGPVTYDRFSRSGRRLIKGSFSIRRARAGERNIINAKSGGACLVAQIQGRIRTCNTDIECDMPTGRRTALHGYCVPTPDDPQFKQCWIAPATESCLRNQADLRDYETPPIDPGEMRMLARNIIPDYPRPVRWMVLGCLNGPATGLPCKGDPGEKMYFQGPVNDIP